METSRLQKNITLLPWLAFLILTRLLPHPPNTAPIFCAAFALSYFLSRQQITLLGLIAFVLSDILLSTFNSYPAFGLWSFFTYTGFIISFLFGSIYLKSFSLRPLFSVLVSSVFCFWVWTNFGTWFATSMYPKTFAGLMACFVAGIPFLNNALLGQMAWGVIIFTPLIWYQKRGGAFNIEISGRLRA